MAAFEAAAESAAAAVGLLDQSDDEAALALAQAIVTIRDDEDLSVDVDELLDDIGDLSSCRTHCGRHSRL